MPDALDLTAAYRAAVRESALEYQRTDRVGYTTILNAVMEGYRGELGEYRKRMHEVQRRCATASGLPAFDAWCATQPTLTEAGS